MYNLLLFEYLFYLLYLHKFTFSASSQSDDVPPESGRHKTMNPFEISLGPLKVTVKQGDITSEKTDVIFCYTTGKYTTEIHNIINVYAICIIQIMKYNYNSCRFRI